jgi:hypothetical protein
MGRCLALGAIGMAKAMYEVRMVRGLGDISSATCSDVAPLRLSIAVKSVDGGAKVHAVLTP